MYSLRFRFSTLRYMWPPAHRCWSGDSCATVIAPADPKAEGLRVTLHAPGPCLRHEQLPSGDDVLPGVEARALAAAGALEQTKRRLHTVGEQMATATKLMPE